MNASIRAGLLYFAVVLGTGFVLGVVRVLLVVPRIGERWAELAEMPIMAIVIYLSAGHVLRRFPDVRLPGRSQAVGFLGLALAVCAELGLAAILQERTLAEYLGSRGKMAGAVYLAMLVVFALMPRLRLSNHA